MMGIGSCAPPTLPPSQPLAVVEAGQPFSKPLPQPAKAARIHMSLEPGSRVKAWKTACERARAVGDQLPGRPAVAVLKVTYQNERQLLINLRYGESVSAVARDWWNETDGFIYHLPFADLSQARPTADSSFTYEVRYAMDIPNPWPASAITEAKVAIPDSLADGSRLRIYGFTATEQGRSAPAFFVAPWGNDEGAGSFGQPWASLHHAAETIPPGSRVYVRGGLYACTKPIVFDSLVAAAAQPTEVIGWPGETARFDFRDTHLTYGPNPRGKGSGWLDLDLEMISITNCRHFTLKNLHLQRSRARGIGAEFGEHIQLLYNSVYLTFAPGIRFGHIKNGKVLGNTLIRPTSLLMGPAQLDNAGEGLLAMDTGDSTFIMPHDPIYMPEINASRGDRSRKPPMEGIDCGKFSDIEIAYNEIAWADKETCLVDGDVEGLRMHHNYVHDAHNRPWAWGIAPNGYGVQRQIELDHNIAVRVGSGIGIGTEGGGEGAYVKIHHNLSYDCAWNPHSVTGAWGDSDADLHHIAVYNNTAWRNGYLDSNTGPAGGIAISFASGGGKAGRAVSGKVEDITVANNLILQPRDYALALVYPGDPEENRIHFYNNYTDLKAPSSIFNLPENAPWRSYRASGLQVVTDSDSVLRHPEAGDFRLSSGSALLEAGAAIDSSGAYNPERPTYIGAFGPEDGWVEYPKPATVIQKLPSQ